MHLEKANDNCPLCKRLVATNGHPDSTRLCEECRSLIHTIMPRASSKSFVAAEQSQSPGQPHFATIGRLFAPVSFDADLSDTYLDSQEHPVEFASFDPVTDFDEVPVDPAIETEYFDDFATSDDEDHISAKALADPVDEAITRPEEAETAEPQVLLMADLPESFQNKADEEPARLISLPHEIEAATQADLEVIALKSALAGKDKETIAGKDTTSEQEAADPWDDPLPVWEYSRSEYPLYVGVSERKRSSRLKSLLVPAILLLLLVAAYLVFRSSGTAPHEEQAVVNSEQGKTESALPATPAQATDATKPASDDVERASATSDATANVVAGTQWRHALQALASSSQDEANLFARKLVSAGIPAYVISADIAGRGKWFRVRVGGFNTAQEAQRFMTEARLRAKAVGINLKDLNVVEYEKP